jgi:hypothetical protein
MGKTVYLDTANWYDLVEGGGKVPFTCLKSPIVRGQITPVLSFVHLLEFGRRTEPYRNRVAEYIDTIASYRGLLWLRDEKAVARAEMKKAFMKWMGLCSPPISVFSTRFADAYIPPHASLEVVAEKTITVSQMMENFCDLPRYRAFITKRRKADTFEGFSRLREAYQNSGRLPVPKAIESVKNFLADVPKVIRTPAGIEIKVTTEMRAQFLNVLKWEEIPSIWLRVSAMVGWSMTSGGESPSDIEDLFHLVAIAYCDKSFADKRTIDALKKGSAYN